MDFGLSEEQLALQDLAKKIFRGLCTTESLAALEASGEPFHRVVWDGLAKAQMLGVSLPESVGGSGFGLLELCIVLEQAGDAVCPVPLVPTLVMAALPIAEFGAPTLKKLLEPVVRGESVLTAALVESAEPVFATETPDGFRLAGAKDCVPALPLATRVLVPARTEAGTTGQSARRAATANDTSVFLVDLQADGVKTARQTGTNGELLGRLELDGAIVPRQAVLGDVGRGSAIIDWTLERAWIAQCALELGIARRALILTAKYVSERHQFGRPIGSFQAVAQRAADAYVDVETIRLTLWRAAWLLDQGKDARREVAVAKIIAAEAGHRVVCAAQHLHGGIGFDRDYPLFRYFLASKQNEFSLGSAAFHVARLGRMIAGDER